MRDPARRCSGQGRPMRGTSRGGWLALLIVLVLMMAPGARGQTSQVDNSGVDTKTPPPVKDDAVPVEPGLKLRPGERLRMDVNLVMVPVTVTDGLNRLVTGLERENFFIFSDGVLQDIKTFSVEDAPVSIGIVLDLSGSMTNKVDKAKQAILQLLKTSNPQDEYFVITFNDRPELVQDFTSSEADVRTHLVSLQPGHRTALLDAMYYGIVKMKGAKYSRRALIVVSDGGDNRSRYTNGEVASLLKEADTEIFAMGIFDMYAPSPEEVHGPELLSEYCEGTGGRLFKVDDIDDLPDIATKISASLRNQYVLGFAPKDQKRDGKWRKLKVRLVPPNGLPALEVHARNGYYAPAD
jgi:Ca-activated chloride channel family protein